MPFIRVRGRWLAPAATLSIGVVALAVAPALPSPTDAAPVVFLGAVAAGVLTLLALAAPPAAARRLAAASILLVPILVRPLDDPTPWAIAFALLAAAAVGAALATTFGEDSGRRPLRWIAWTTAAQWILHADRIWQGPPGATLAGLVLAPVLAGLLVGRLCRHDPRLGLIAALLAFSTGPGWTWTALAALGVVLIAIAGFSRAGVRDLAPMAAGFAALPGVLVEPWLGVALAGLGVAALSPADAAESPAARRLLAALAGVATATVTAGALITLGAGAPPWSLEHPIAGLVGALERHAGLRPQLLHEGPILRLEKEPIRFDPPERGPIRTLSLDSFLLDGAALACGSAVAELALVDGDRTVWSSPVFAGGATGDWAAERPDVSARAACDAPRPHLRWPAPTGRFFSRRYRAVWEIGRPLDASHVELRPVEPDPGGRLVVTRLAIGS